MKSLKSQHIYYSSLPAEACGISSAAPISLLLISGVTQSCTYSPSPIVLRDVPSSQSLEGDTWSLCRSLCEKSLASLSSVLSSGTLNLKNVHGVQRSVASLGLYMVCSKGSANPPCQHRLFRFYIPISLGKASILKTHFPQQLQCQCKPALANE